MKTYPRSIIGTIFFVAHAVIVLVIMGSNIEGSWGGFFVMVMDLPISLLYMPFLRIINQWPIYIIVGGAWWYFIGILIGKFASWCRRCLH